MTQKQMKELYRETDRFHKALKVFIRTLFNQLLALSFDEVNVITVRKKTRRVYRQVDEFNRKHYREIADFVDDWYLYTILEDDDGKRIDSAKVVEDTLKSYNAVTGYIYSKELDRKRLRQVEEMMTYATLRDRERYRKALKRCADLLYTQSMQYGVDVADEALMARMKLSGVQKVRWVTEHDERVCEVCKGLDNRMFPIDSVPEKPHYNCRCIVIPVNV